MLYIETNLFENFFKDDNKLIGKIHVEKLLSRKIIIPNIQRIKDDQKVKKIIEYQDKFFKKHKRFNFLGLINIHNCSEDKKEYLLDGQHRFSAINILYNEMLYKDFFVNIEVIHVNTLDEIKENYLLINKNTELPEFPDDIDKNIPEKAAKFFINKYKDVWTTKRKTMRPKLNKNHFQIALGYLTEKLQKSTIEKYSTVYSEDLVRLLEDKNKKMSLWPVESYVQRIRKIKKWPEYKAICKKNKFFLGMYAYTSEEYCYGWVKDILKEETGVEVKKAKKTRKKKPIPKTLRDSVWMKYVKDQNNPKCYCCEESITLKTWQCGHVISEANGGTLDIDNLRPICQTCNTSMGTQNMEEFKSKHFKHKKNGWFSMFTV
tara:strand:- start:8430 stop:9554 length:1125 start_codon:yes stop_codon:yes gene_type:complete